MKAVYVEFLFPGTFFPEISLVRFSGEPIPVPANAYGWNVKWRHEEQVAGETLTGPFHKVGGTTLIGNGFTLPQIKALFGQSDRHRTLLSNIEGNAYAGACLCRTGNWQPVENDTTVVASAETVTP